MYYWGMLKELFRQNTPEDALMALATITLWLLVFHLVRKFALFRLRKLADRSSTKLDDFVCELLEGTRVMLAMAIGFYIATRMLEMPDKLDTIVTRLVIALMVLQAGFWAERGLRFWLKHRFDAEASAPEAGSQAMTKTLLTFIGRLGIWVIILLLILDNLGMDVTALVASLGIGGVAVALAVQNILGDLFASLSITIDKPFVIGDFIIVGDLMGTVEHVGLKTTRLRSLSGEQLVFANNDLLSSRIRNFKRMQERRVVFNLGVTYDTSPEQVREVAEMIREAIQRQTLTRFDRAHFKGFAASSLDFEAVYYMTDPDFNRYMDTQQAINLELLERFNAQGIQFAFPTQTLHVQGRWEARPPEALVSDGALSKPS